MTASKEAQRGAGGCPPSWKKRKLLTVEHVRAYVASLINRTEAGEVDAQSAARLGNIANILVGIINSSDIEKRLAALEEKQK